MEHWIAVGLDIWWVIRWPLLCGLWFVSGYHEAKKTSEGFGWQIISFGMTLLVANT